MTFIKRVIAWNKARYNQEHNSELTYKLLKSEVIEFAEANAEDDKVAQIDALVDIIYVATGAMWKLGLNESQIVNCIAAVCDANDTKTAVRTDPSIKANIDKGANFVPPEKAIERIINNGH